MVTFFTLAVDFAIPEINPDVGNTSCTQGESKQTYYNLLFTLIGYIH